MVDNVAARCRHEGKCEVDYNFAEVVGAEAECEKEMCVLWREGIFREAGEVCMCVMLEGGCEDEYG